MVDIILQVVGEHDRHGLKSIQNYFNLFDDGAGRVTVNGIDCGEVDCHNVGFIINEGLSRRLVCRRCDGKWVCRGETAPKFCPKCNSPYWDKPRKAII